MSASEKRSVQARSAARLRRAKLMSDAESVFGDRGDAAAFLRAPHPELDGDTPLRAALSKDGVARVERILNALAHGLPV
jgi:uncharacterized protein (DUF2384 family)